MSDCLTCRYDGRWLTAALEDMTIRLRIAEAQRSENLLKLARDVRVILDHATFKPSTPEYLAAAMVDDAIRLLEKSTGALRYEMGKPLWHFAADDKGPKS